MEKACFKCGETKPLDAFYKHPMMLDGHLNKCAECTKIDVRANRKARIEYYREYDKVRNREPERSNSRFAGMKLRPRQQESDPVKRAARIALGNALRDGKIQRPPECQVCSVTDDLHGHHEDYSKPLEVIWVCSACHVFIHKYWRVQDAVAA